MDLNAVTLAVYIYATKAIIALVVGYNFAHAREPGELISVKKNDKLMKNS
jgi:hypothetical protein